MSPASKSFLLSSILNTVLLALVSGFFYLYISGQLQEVPETIDQSNSELSTQISTLQTRFDGVENVNGALSQGISDNTIRIIALEKNTQSPPSAGSPLPSDQLTSRIDAQNTSIRNLTTKVVALKNELKQLQTSQRQKQITPHFVVVSVVQWGDDTITKVRLEDKTVHELIEGEMIDQWRLLNADANNQFAVFNKDQISVVLEPAE